MGKKNRKASTSSGKNAKKSSGTGRCNPKQPNDKKGEKRKNEEVKLREPEEEMVEIKEEMDFCMSEYPFEFSFGLDPTGDDEFFSSGRVIFCREPYKEGEVVHSLHAVMPNNGFPYENVHI